VISAIDFYDELLTSGRVRVAAMADDPPALDEAVVQAYRAARAQLAFDPPPIAPAAGRWAMVILYRACQALVYREMPAQAVREVLSKPCPLPPSPQVCYSVDLALRFIPDLIKLAKGIAQDDPLVSGLLELARAWPLSSVGVALEDDVNVEPFIGEKSLLQLYVDRIIERGDILRLKHPLVREAAREALGMYRELSPLISAELDRLKQEEQTCP
jgi:hypothetical protein